MCSSEQKKREVVDSRVESRVGKLIACYSFDFSQICVCVWGGGGGVFTNLYKLSENTKKNNNILSNMRF